MPFSSLSRTPYLCLGLVCLASCDSEPEPCLDDESETQAAIAGQGVVYRSLRNVDGDGETVSSRVTGSDQPRTTTGAAREIAGTIAR